MLKRLDLDIDLQIKSKATHQKRETDKAYREDSTTIVKGEEGLLLTKKSRSRSFLLERASLVFSHWRLKKLRLQNPLFLVNNNPTILKS